jgi:predicted Zn-dependent peptidase
MAVNFERHTLSNGLRVLAHRDPTTPMAAFNLLYDVGARDEHPDRTGFAHLFEHLMFEGSVHIPDYDVRLQRAGGENNAFTTNDITNYYLTLPAVNLETAFWLESDRMLGLALSEEKLETQKNVVVEEYRQSYLNQPYGDAWLLLRPLAWQRHPYRWATIGKSIDHIRQARLEQVRDFFRDYYHPGNAILAVAGQVDPQHVFRLAETWFGDIPPGKRPGRVLPAEAPVIRQRRLRVERDVPSTQLYLAFHTCGRGDKDFFPADLLSDILASGESARFARRLVRGRKLVGEAHAYLTGSLDPGLFLVQATLHREAAFGAVEEAIWEELQALSEEPVGGQELQKVKNKVEAAHTFAESHVLAKAINLAYYELMGDAGLLNRQMEAYARVRPEDIQQQAKSLFRREGAAILHYAARETVNG